MSASKKDEIVARTTEYLDTKHALDPIAYPAEIKAIAQHLGIARGTFYNWLRKDDAEMRQLVRRIEDADKAAADGRRGAPGASQARTGAPSSHTSLAEVERELGEGFRRVVWAMRGFVSLIEASESVAEAPLYMAELDAKLSQCRAIYHDLKVPYGEWLRRRRDAQAPVGPAAEIALGEVLELLLDDEPLESESVP